MKLVKSSKVMVAKNKAGLQKFWQLHIYSDGADYYTRTSWHQLTKTGRETKEQFSEPYYAAPTNEGRANERDSKAQAEFEFDAIIKKQRDAGFLFEGEVAEEDARPLPMLAHKFRDHGHKVEYPVYVQPKLDGMRMLSNGKSAWSRGNKDILPKVYEHLKWDDLRMVLDGELILPGNGPLQDTMSAAKKYRPGISDQLQYWVYDYIPSHPVDQSVPFEKRLSLLSIVLNSANVPKGYIATPTYLASSEREVSEYHQMFVEQGYEGTIIRDPRGKYEIGKRSYSLLKMKDFQDEEFEIVDVIDGGGSAAGQAIFRVKTKEGNIFESTPQASHEDRKEMFKNRKKLIGLWLTCKFYGKTKDGIPVFNNGVAIRDWRDFQ